MKSSRALKLRLLKDLKLELSYYLFDNNAAKVRERVNNSFSSPYEEFETFKNQTCDLLYDYYFPHKLDWPASCCRWVG